MLICCGVQHHRCHRQQQARVDAELLAVGGLGPLEARTFPRWLQERLVQVCAPVSCKPNIRRERRCPAGEVAAALLAVLRGGRVPLKVLLLRRHLAQQHVVDTLPQLPRIDSRRRRHVLKPSQRAARGKSLLVVLQVDHAGNGLAEATIVCWTTTASKHGAARGPLGRIGPRWRLRRQRLLARCKIAMVRLPHVLIARVERHVAVHAVV